MSHDARAPKREIQQPVLGLIGLLFVILAVVALGFFPTQTAALTTTITIITFGLPVLIVATLWWNGWPFNGLPPATASWARFALIIVGTLALAAIGQAVTGRLDLGGMFGAEGGFGLFPYGFVLAASIFIAMLQLTFVTRKMPFHRMGPVSGGFAALAGAWVLGLLQYFFVINWTEGPGLPPAPPVAGIGALHGLDWPAILLAICVFQMVFFVLLEGFPFQRIRQPVAVFIVVNVFTIGGGILLHWAARALGLNDGQISALAAGITAAVILIMILFDGWPFRDASRAGGRVGRVVTAAVATAIVLVILFNVGGQFYPAGEGVPPIELWVAGVCLNLIAAFAIVHVAVFGRWPLPTPAAPAAAEATEDALAS